MSLSVISSSYSQVPANFTFTCNGKKFHMHTILIVLAPVSGNLECFHFLTLVNRSAMNMDMQESL